jgi:hypothetical protein
MTNPDSKQIRLSRAFNRIPEFLYRRTFVSDVVQGIIAGGVLAFFTANLITTACSLSAAYS